jgi:hypothetical protein
MIIAIAIIYRTRGLTALKSKIQCGFFQFTLSKQINNLQSNTPSKEQEQKGPGAALLVIFSPKHSHTVQKAVLTSGPQQSSPSKPQTALLFSSSQKPSPM